MLTVSKQATPRCGHLPHPESLEKWAGEQGIGGGKSRQLFAEQLERFRRGFKKYEQPRKFKLIAEEFTVDPTCGQNG